MPRKKTGRKPRKWSINDLKQLVPKVKNYTELLKALNLCFTGGNNNTVRKYVKQLGLDTSHFETRHQIFNRSLYCRPKISTKDILIENSNFSRSSLKRRLLDENWVDNKCYICGLLPTWCGEKLVLILDHINGVRNDNRLENLRLVCPNCNSQLDTHCGKKDWK